MKDKQILISELYNETLLKISNTSESWLSFLESAAMNYKYLFHDQVLIYAQRPNALAVARMNDWNDKVGRWVKRDSKGIALLTETDGKSSIYYVFDVADTYSLSRKKFRLWSVDETIKDDVILNLEKKFNISSHYEELGLLIKELSKILVLDTDNITEESINILSNSVAYIVMKRIGINPKTYYTSNDFIDIRAFNDYDKMLDLGVEIREIAYELIRDIHICIEKYKSENRIIAEKDKTYYDEDEEIFEGRDKNEINLFTNGELPNSKLSNSNNRSPNKGEIRNNEIRILEDKKETTLYDITNEESIRATLDGSSNDSRNESRTNDGRNVEEREYNRRIESQKSDDLDWYDEQLESDSGGDSNERIDLQLKNYKKDNNYNLILDSKINQILSSIQFLKVSNEDIITYFKNNEAEKERSLFLKRIFNSDFTGVLIDNEMYGYKTYENGLLLWKGNFLNREEESLVSWDDLTYHYEAMILLNQLDLRMKPNLSTNEKFKLVDEINYNNKILTFPEKFIDKALEKIIVNKIGKEKIENIFNKSISKGDNIIFIKNYMGIGGSTDVIRCSGVNEEHNNNGIKFSLGYDENRPMTTITWSNVIDKISNILSREQLNDNVEQLDERIDTKNQLSLFMPKEQELAERILEEFNNFDIKYKGTFYISSVELKRWEHISSKKRNLSIMIKSNACTGYNETSFTYFNTDKTDEEIIANALENSKLFDYLYKDKDFSVSITPDIIFIYYHNFDEKKLELENIPIGSMKEKNISSSIMNIEQAEEYVDDLEAIFTKQNNTNSVETFLPKGKYRSTIINFDIYPEIKNEDRNNFQITDDLLGVGSDREKFNRNLAAIKVLKQCEEENRFATPEEQKILSQYVGWGGLPQAFEENNSSWADEHLKLKNVLDDEEYRSAMSSTRTSFYTPPVVIRTMYKALESLVMKDGNILEPSCGVGNFLGMLPDTLKDCKLYGIEADSISGRIARQLYQKSSIAVQGYESTELPDSFFDGAIGNVPFDTNKLLDKRYDKYNFLIHDYFFAKTLDKVRPGGIVAFITSKGTLDKENPNVRKYIAQRADLLGAIRLPNSTFKDNAGTKVTSDIIFLQKRDSITDIEPDWVYLDTDENGIKMNKYFVDNPDMICGNMKMESTRFGMDSTCEARTDISLEEQLNNAISNIHAEIKVYEIDDIGEDEEDLSIPADYNVRNFSYTLVDNKIYYRENSRMYPQELPLTTENRVKGLIEIRECVRTLLELQTEDFPEEDIKQEQVKLNKLYDSFTKKYGLINSRANTSAFSDDNSFYLLCSLEILDENKELLKKADMFTKRTILPHKEITSVDTANEALIVSLSEKARVDLEFMQKLCDLDMDKMLSDLEGVIFNVPEYGEPNKWVTADEYLSGNIREKLKIAKEFAEDDPKFNINVKCLEEVMPKDLEPQEISVRLGATWLPPDVIDDFITYLLSPSLNIREYIKVHFMESTAQWNIKGKNYDRGNVKAYSTYGTSRINAYKIIEETLNLKDVRIYDYKEIDGKKVPELNKKETAIAQAKQEQIKTAFDEWIWNDVERRDRLSKIYNEKFNSNRPREYDGSHINFHGMNPEITLRPHQLNAIARVLYGNSNTLLAHEVGAGKTFEMVAAAMESKRLGLCNKSMFVVPNHIVEQFSSEFLQLYPSANILITTKKDFETANRKKFCSRIATGDYDAVIISHSQFEKIPISVKRQKIILQNQIDDITRGVQDLKDNKGENFTIKQLVRLQKSLENKMAKLNDTSRKDDVVTFEELGVDRIFVDEAHYYKNLFLYTKMRNVGGIAQTEAQKSSDLFMKCRYIDELTGGRGIVFATGTPVSNSMVELYTMQRYLQYAELEKRNLQQFDAWASTFGETVTAIELAPEGTGYRAKTRFAKFYNLPELMAMFKETADIQTADMLNLPVPEAHYETIVAKPTEIQKQMVQELSNRAEMVRNKQVDPSTDNMLKITNDGRKLALDQRLMNDMLPDDPESKVSLCANNIYRIWQENKEEHLTQLVFCDLSTPSEDKFNVYDELSRKVQELGVPEDEVEFIHNANTDIQKKTLFSKVRSGIKRILLGSTSKMGAGTNCQDKLIAIHNLDCPWRPSDLTQRIGRIVRQGNKNKEVYIYNYVTEGTFDAYLYQLVENKQRFISQIMTSKTPVRFAEDIDESALNYAQIKALAAGNPLILEKTELDTQVAKLKLLKQNHLSQIYAMQDKIVKYYPSEIKRLESLIEGYKKDIEQAKNNTINSEEKFQSMTLKDIVYTDKKQAGDMILELCKSISSNEKQEIGSYRGFKMELEYDSFYKCFHLYLKNEISHCVTLGNDNLGNITRINNEIDDLSFDLEREQIELENTKVQFENAKEECKRPFKQEQELKEKSKRLEEVNILLNMDEKDNEVIDFDDNNTEIESQRCNKDYER